MPMPMEARSARQQAAPFCVSILRDDSQRCQAVRICRHEEDRRVHLADPCGAGDAGRFGFRVEYASEGGLASADRAAVSRPHGVIAIIRAVGKSKVIIRVVQHVAGVIITRRFAL
jgi:hypothetical protein